MKVNYLTCKSFRKDISLYQKLNGSCILVCVFSNPQCAEISGRAFVRRSTPGTNEVKFWRIRCHYKTKTDSYSWRVSIITIHYLQFSLILSANSRLFSHTADLPRAVFDIFSYYTNTTEEEWKKTSPFAWCGNWRLLFRRDSLKRFACIRKYAEEGVFSS